MEIKNLVDQSVTVTRVQTLYAISCLQQLRTTLGLQDRKEHGR